jgi:glycosyltransferase involved in cell wall biosynthesis
MKILVASHTYVVDLNCEKWRLLAHLEPGIEVTVIVPQRWQPGGVQQRSIVSRYWQDGSFRVVPVSNFSQSHQGLLCFGADLIPLLQEFRPHIMQVEQGSKALAYAELITLNRWLGLNAKNLFFTWWNLPYHLAFPVSLIEAYNLRQTTGVVAGNQDGADILRQRGYVGPIAVLPQLGVDEHLFRPLTQPDLANKLGIHPEDFIVGYVGRFVAEKGILTLYHALRQIRDRPWKWLLVGRGPLQAELMTIAATDGLSDRLIWVESVPHQQVPNYINLMQTLVLPSQTSQNFRTLTATGWKEQFGHVLIEAMACQVPVIGSNSGEVPHVIATAGLIFPEGDIAALKNCLLQLIFDAKLRLDLAKRGYERVLQYYTNRAIAQRQLAFYRSLF